MTRRELLNGFKLGFQLACTCYVARKFLRTRLGQIAGDSMLPTLRENDVVFVSPATKQLSRGDIVVFNTPYSCTRRPCVKRVWALPEETFEKDDGTLLKIPKGHMWVQGDNLSNSTDSRVFGPVPLALLTGRVTYRVSMLCIWYLGLGHAGENNSTPLSLVPRLFLRKE